jgi:hypothetical protein
MDTDPKPEAQAPEAFDPATVERMREFDAALAAAPKPPSKIRQNREAASLAFWANLQAAALRKYGR